MGWQAEATDVRWTRPRSSIETLEYRADDLAQVLRATVLQPSESPPPPPPPPPSPPRGGIQRTRHSESTSDWG
jgi:hypothetical protein